MAQLRFSPTQFVTDIPPDANGDVTLITIVNDGSTWANYGVTPPFGGVGTPFPFGFNVLPDVP
jgi:hypothetical protein